MSAYIKEAVFMFLAVSVMGGCVSIPVQPPNPQSGAMAINTTVFLKGDILNLFPGTIRPIHVYFAKVEEGGDLFTQKEVIQSNHTVGSDIYLLNAEPGVYVAIGVHAVEEREKKEEEKTSAYDMGKMQFFKEVFFPKKLIEMVPVAAITQDSEMPVRYLPSKAAPSVGYIKELRVC